MWLLVVMHELVGVSLALAYDEATFYYANDSADRGYCPSIKVRFAHPC